MESIIHQLYCTHCTYGTSYEHQRTTGAVKDQSFEYSARAGSMAREKSHDYFRKIEPFMYYHLPGDLPRDQMLKHDAASTVAWRRLVYLPSMGGMQVLAFVSYRTTDTQGCPGSYFAHVLLSERPNGDPAWSASDALRLWGSQNWVVSDADFPNLELKTYRSLDEFRTSGPHTARMIDDQVLLSFLTAPAGTNFDDPGQLIPTRWKQKSPSERRELLIDTLQGFLELNFDRRQTMLLAIEPCLSALIFYGVARLLPKSWLAEKFSFSTFESHEQRPQTALAATTFIDVENSDLPRDPSQSRGFAINTFKPDKSPQLPWKQRNDKPQYACNLVEMFVDRGPDVVTDLLLRFEKAGAVSKDDKVGAVSKEDLEHLIQADALSDAFLNGDSLSAAGRLKSLRKPAAKFLRDAVQSRLAKIMARSGPTITSAPPPPPSSAVENRGSIAAEAAEANQPAISLAPSMPIAWQGSAELRQISDDPSRVLNILKLIAAEDAPEDAQPVVTKLLLAYVENGRDQFDRLLRTDRVAKAHKRRALRIAVEQHQQIPARCEWLWTETKSDAGQLALLTTLLIDLDDDLATTLLTSFLATQPPPAADKVSAVFDALTQACQSLKAKRELLVGFVDHPQLATATLLGALRISSSIRKLVFEQYAKLLQDEPERDLRLPPLLESEVDELTDPGACSRLLDLLDDARPLLTDEAAKRIGGWLKIRKRFEELKSVMAEKPNLLAQIRGSANEAKFQEHGMELVKESRLAMPDKLYAIDHKGQERCEILQNIGEQLLKPRLLPDSFWQKLSAAMSGNGWQILYGGPARLRRAPAKRELLAQIKQRLIPAAIALSVVVGVSWGGWQLYQLVQEQSVAVVEPGGSGDKPSVPVVDKSAAGDKPSISVVDKSGAKKRPNSIKPIEAPSLLTQLAVPQAQQFGKFLTLTDKQFEEFLKLSDQQFAVLFDSNFPSPDKVDFSIDECLNSFGKLQADRHEKWLRFLWPKLPPERQIDLLVKLPPKERERQLDALKQSGRDSLKQLLNTKVATNEQLVALAQVLDNPQLALILKNLEGDRGTKILDGLDTKRLQDADVSVFDALSPAQLATLVLEFPPEKLRVLLADKVSPDKLKKLFEHSQKDALIAKLMSAAPELVAQLQKEIASPKPSTTTEPPVKVQALDFERGPEDRLIAYRELPPYPTKPAEPQKEFVFALPGEWEEPTRLILHGFEEHKKMLGAKGPVLKLVTEVAKTTQPSTGISTVAPLVPTAEKKSEGTTMRILSGKDGPGCVFELRPNRITFEWTLSSELSQDLQTVICSCVLEIKRGQQDSLFISFLPPGVLEKPLAFNESGIYDLTKELKKFALNNTPLILSEGLIHATKPGKKAGLEHFPFPVPAKTHSRTETHSVPGLSKPPFGFSTAEVWLEKTARGIKGTPKGVVTEELFQLSLKVEPRKLSKEETEQKDKHSEDIAQLKSHQTTANNGKTPMERLEALRGMIKILGEEEPKGVDPQTPAYTNWALKLQLPKKGLAKIKTLNDNIKAIERIPETDRRTFWESGPIISGTVLRVVGGKRDGNAVDGGVVVEALKLLPPPSQESKDKPK